MEQAVLKATKRGVIGKGLGALRRGGELPGVIYGKALGSPMAITMNMRDATRLLRHVGSSTMLTIDVDGQQIPTLVRERQRDFLKGEFLHIDFLAISLTEKVRTMVSLVLDGVSPAVKDGGMLITGLEEIEVEALPQNLPENLIVDISVLTEIGSGIHVSDLTLPTGVELLTDLEEMIAVVTAPTVEAESTQAEGTEGESAPAEPEVIEKGKGEEDAEG